MIELAFADIIFWVAGLVVSVVVTAGGVLYGLLRGLAKYNDQRQVLWDKTITEIFRRLDEIDRKLEELGSDHKEIKRDLSMLKEEIGNKVEKIVDDHASHEIKQEATYEKTKSIELLIIQLLNAKH